MTSVGNNNGTVGDNTFGVSTPSNYTSTIESNPDATDFDIDSLINLMKATQTFNHSQSVPTNPSIPWLRPPDTSSTSSSPHVYDSISQGIVNNFFIQDVKDQLNSLFSNGTITASDSAAIWNYILSGTPPLTNEAQITIANQITQQATSKTISEANLPSTWAFGAKDDASWTSQPVVPYSADKQAEINAAYQGNLSKMIDHYIADNPLSQGKIDALKTALNGGTVDASIEDLFTELKGAAAFATQGTYGLPSTWQPGTQEPTSWTPIYLSIVNPTSIAQTVSVRIIENSISILNSLSSATQSLIDSLPEGPDRVSLTNFLGSIGDAIQGMQNMMREIQVTNARSTQKTQQANQDALASRKDIQNTQQGNMAKMEEKANQMASMGMNMKIAGPLLSALATIASVVITIATLGTGTVASIALIIAAVTIGTLMTAYSVADSCTNCTSALVNMVNDAIDKATAGMSPAEAKACKTALTVAIVLILVVVIAIMVASGNATEAADAATEVSMETVTAVVAQAVGKTTQVVEAASEAAMASMTAVVKQLALSTGVQIVKQIALQTMIMTILSSNTFPELASAIAKQCGASSENQQAVELTVMAITMITCMAVSIKLMGSSTANATKDAGEESQSILQSIKNVFKFDEGSSLLGYLSKSVKDFASIKDLGAIGETEGIFKMDLFFQAIPLLTNAGAAASKAAMGFKMAEFTKTQGNIDEAIQNLQGMIKALQQLLTSLMDDISQNAATMNSLDRTYTGFYQSATNTLQHISDSIIPS